MPQSDLIDIDNLEQEFSALQAELQSSLLVLARLKEISAEFDDLATEYTAIKSATGIMQAEALHLATIRVEQEQEFAHSVARVNEDRTRLGEEWQQFRTKAESEQNQVLRVAMTTQQEVIDRAAAQDRMLASLDERMEKMNQALAAMMADLQDSRRRQKITSSFLVAIVLLTVGLSAFSAWHVFF
jgi:hypothetical protein